VPTGYPLFYLVELIEVEYSFVIVSTVQIARLPLFHKCQQDIQKSKSSNNYLPGIEKLREQMDDIEESYVT
jgi:hypothetical protein